MYSVHCKLNTVQSSLKYILHFTDKKVFKLKSQFYLCINESCVFVKIYIFMKYTGVYINIYIYEIYRGVHILVLRFIFMKYTGVYIY